MDLARDEPAGLVLLQPLVGQLRREELRAGSARDRHPGDLVGIHPGARRLPGLVACPPGLARRGRARWRGGWLAAMVLVRLGRSSHHVLLLRGGVRPVPGDRDHALPRAAHRPRHGGRGAQGGGRYRSRRLPDRGAGEFLLPVSSAGRPGHSVLVLAVPYVVSRLDLTRAATLAGPGAQSRCRSRQASTARAPNRAETSLLP